jgi:hypothetical protein
MEYNKLMAEFMGMTYEDPNDRSVMIKRTPQGNEVVPIESMRYHTSWDWLMPVIENIDHLSFGNIQSIENALSTRSIDDTYESVVQFIKNYKTN